MTRSSIDRKRTHCSHSSSSVIRELPLFHPHKINIVIPPAQVTQARSKLPAQTRYIEISGGTHSFFGDYGPQDGDGQPTISHEEARTQILKASHALF